MILPHLVHLLPKVRPMVVAHEVAFFPVDETDGLGFVEIDEIDLEIVYQRLEVVEHEFCRFWAVDHGRVVENVVAREEIFVVSAAVFEQEKIWMVAEDLRMNHRRADPVVEA